MSQERHELSSGQEQLWFLDQLFPGGSAYNVSVASTIRGPLDTAILQAAVAAVVAHDDMLRVTFGAEDGVPYQQVNEFQGLDLDIRDVRGDDEAALARLVADEAGLPFDLGQGPLYRFALLRIAADHHIFVCTIHHILVDGWSVELVNQQISTAYRALAAGGTPRLPDPPASYFDYVRHQRQNLDDAVLEEQLTFWQQRLAGLPVLDFPTDRPRASTRSMHGAQLAVQFPDKVAQAAHQLAEQAGVSLFAPLVAALQAVAARYTGETDIPLGVTMFGRPEPEWETIVGFFANMAVLRGDLSGDPTMLDIIERAAEGVFEMYDNDRVPFEKVVDRVAPVRDTSRNPLFQIAVQLLGAENSGRGLTLPGLSVEPMHATTSSSRFDLTLNFRAADDTLGLDIEYSTDLFDQERIEALVAHLERVLIEAAADPVQRLSELTLLDDGERERLLAWGRGAPSSRDPRPVHVVLADIAADQPDLLAATYQGQSMTYGELDRRATVLARHLRLLGVQHEEIVAVAMERELTTLVAMFGVLKAGAAYTVIDAKQPAARLNYMLEDTAAPVVLTTSALAGGVPSKEGRRLVCLDTEWPEVERLQGEEPLVEWASRDSLVYVLYTSGSTGHPKGVQLEHRGLMSFAESYQHDFQLGPGERLLQMRPLTFDMSHGEIIAALTCGAALVLVPEAAVTDPDALAALIVAEQPTYIGMPTTLMALVDADPYPSVRSVMNGGEAVPGDLVNKWNLPGRIFVNAYGPTEAAVACTGYVCERVAWRASPPIGTPYLDRQVYVVDPKLDLVPVGIAGEILIGGDEGLARGYLNQPELTEESFVPDPLQAGRRVYRTGDLGRWNHRGQLEFIGRRDSQVKLRGQRLELEEIEATLTTHPGVHMAAVTLHTDDRGDDRLIGWVSTVDGQQPTAAELRDHVAGFLPAYMVPAVLQFLDELPLSSTKKIDRKALPAPDLSSEETDADVREPSTETEARVVEIFAEVLAMTRVGTDQNFFALGGSSVQAMRVVSRLNRTFGVKVAVRQLYGTADVSAIAERIDALMAASPALDRG